ncbi:MAG: HAD family hydrolase [Thermoplasmata archaeon]
MTLAYGSGTIEAVLFDLDDVLVPFETPAAWQWAWRPQGPVLGERRVRAAVRRSLRAWDRRRWHGATGREPPADVPALLEHLRTSLREISGHPLPEAETEAVIHRILRPAGEVERFSDVGPALERLRAASVPWGIATPLPAESAHWLLRRTAIDPAKLLVTGDAPPALPDRAAYRTAAERLGAPPERVVFVGDLFWSDARAAARAGLAAVLVDRHDAWPKVRTGRVESLAGLEAALAAGPGAPADDGGMPDAPES